MMEQLEFLVKLKTKNKADIIQYKKKIDNKAISRIDINLME